MFTFFTVLIAFIGVAGCGLAFDEMDKTASGNTGWSNKLQAFLLILGLSMGAFVIGAGFDLMASWPKEALDSAEYSGRHQLAWRFIKILPFTLIGWGSLWLLAISLFAWRKYG